MLCYDVTNDVSIVKQKRNQIFKYKKAIIFDFPIFILILIVIQKTAYEMKSMQNKHFIDYNLIKTSLIYASLNFKCLNESIQLEIPS